MCCLMMRRYMLLLLHVSLFAFTPMDIATLGEAQKALPYMYCIEDVNDSFSPQTVLENSALHALEKSNIGYTRTPFWCRLDLINSGDSLKEVVLYNPRPGVDNIDVTLFHSGKTQQFTLGDMVSSHDRSYPSVFSNLSVTLKPGETATLISRYYTIGTLEVGWIVQDVKHFMQNENLNFIVIAVFFGFLVAMMLYKFFIYIHIKEPIYLIYSLMILTIIISQASLQGTLHYFFFGVINPFSITVSSWIFTHLFLVLLWLFTYMFFPIRNRSFIGYLLKGIIVYNVAVTLLYSTSYLDDRILILTPVIALIAFFEAIGLFIFSAAMLYQKRAGSLHFFIGHLLYISAIVFYILLLTGKQEFSLFFRHSNALGLFFVISFMSLALSARFKAIKEENERHKTELAKQQRFMLIGTTITYVFHQWKQPLSILSSQVMRLQGLIDHRPHTAVSEISEDIDKMQKNIILLNDTLVNIRNLFTSKSSTTEHFTCKRLFDQLHDTFTDICTTLQIRLTIPTDAPGSIQGNMNMLFNALQNIIQNGIDQIVLQKTPNPMITIAVQESDGILEIIIEDNAGGINANPLESIFDSGPSSKSFGSGIGLSISKEIITSQFNGNIKVQNTASGARFQVRLHYENN